MDLGEVAAGEGSIDGLSEHGRHPWERARAEFVVALLRHEGVLGPGSPARSVLDVGAGDAYVARSIARAFPSARQVTCWDAEYAPEQLAALAAARPDMRFTRARPTTRFSLLLLLDVLEHVAEDGAFLGGLLDACAENGARVLVTVPAWPWLYGDHDRFLRHERRYSPSACARLLRAAGLEIERQGGLFPSLLPVRAGAIAAERAGLRRKPARGVAPGRGGPSAASRLLLAWLRADATLSRMASRVPLSIPGLSYFALCTKP